MASPDLGQINIQVHPHRASGLDVERLVASCETMARGIKACRGFGSSQGEDEGAYINLTFATESVASSWPELRAALLESAEFGAALKRACICICTGAEGWDDYLLLHHFDPEQPLNDLTGS